MLSARALQAPTPCHHRLQEVHGSPYKQDAYHQAFCPLRWYSSGHLREQRWWHKCCTRVKQHAFSNMAAPAFPMRK